MRISAASRLYIAIGGLFSGLVVLSAWREYKLHPALFGIFSEDGPVPLRKTLFYVGGHPVRVWFLIKVLLFLVLCSFLSLNIGENSFKKIIIRVS